MQAALHPAAALREGANPPRNAILNAPPVALLLKSGPATWSFCDEWRLSASNESVLGMVASEPSDVPCGARRPDRDVRMYAVPASTARAHHRSLDAAARERDRGRRA